MHVTLPQGRTRVSTSSTCSEGSGDVITFDADGFIPKENARLRRSHQPASYICDVLDTKCRLSPLNGA